MSEDNASLLLEAAEFGTVDDVRAAFEVCSVNERKEYGKQALRYAARNLSPNTLEIVEFLMEREIEPDWQVLFNASGNIGSCAFDIVKLLTNSGQRCPDGSAGEQVKADSAVLSSIAMNIGPCAFDMMKLLLKRDMKVNSHILRWAVKNSGPCALDMVKLLMERTMDPRWKDIDGFSAFTLALLHKNFAIADYLLACDGFLLSDLVPRPGKLSVDTYKTYREKAVSRVSELVDEKGLPYVRTVAADIEKMLKTEILGPTTGDADALQPLVGKIASVDWVSDARVSSGDFMDGDVER